MSTVAEPVSNYIPSVFENVQTEFKKLINEVQTKHPDLVQQEPEISYILLITKIVHNLNSAAFLASHEYIADAGLVLRSAFESLVLLKLFSYFPEELETWKIESEITKFRNVFISHKYYPDTITVDNLMLCYNELSENARKKVSLETSTKFQNLLLYKKDKLEKKLQSYKTKYCKEITSTNIRKLIEKVIEKESDFECFLRFRLHLYDMNSQVHHSILSSILDGYVKTSFEDYKSTFQGFYRQYGLLSTQLITTLRMHRFFEGVDTNLYYRSLIEGGIRFGLFKKQLEARKDLGIIETPRFWQLNLEELLRKNS